MNNRWQARLLAGCVLGALGLGMGACAVSPEEGAEPAEATASAQQKIEVGVSSRHGMREAANWSKQIEAKRTGKVGVVSGCDQDAWEKNDKSEDASELAYHGIWDSDPECYDWEWCDDTGCHTETYCAEYSSAHTSVDGATICKNDEDWYFLPTASLPFTVGYLGLRAMAAGASHCPFYDYGDGDSWGYDPPAGPENTLTVEVYNAQTLALVATSTSPIGRVWMNLGNPANLSHDLYIRFRGPKEAEYSYRFSLSPQTDWFEDECEY